MADLTNGQQVRRVILDVVGDEGMRALQRARGGMSIWIPLDPAPDHWLSQVLGHKPAQEISRRLSFLDADGHLRCSISFYLAREKTIIQEFREKVRQEIERLLLLGMSNRNTALTIGVTEADVQRSRKYLVAIGKLAPSVIGRRRVRVMLPTKLKILPISALTTNAISTDNKKEMWEVKNSIVDDGLLKGHSNRSAAIDASVSISHVRMRRKLLLASGKLKPGRFAPATPDHSANLGGMVAPSDKVPL